MKKILLFSLLLFPSWVWSVESLEQKAHRGLEALILPDFPKSHEVFQEMMRDEPKDALGYLGESLAIWWQSAVELKEQDEKARAVLYASIEKTVAVAEEMVKTGTDQARGQMYLGAAYGLRGRQDAARKNYFKAYLDGRRAYDLQTQAYTANPELHDTALGLGLYNYYVAALPKIVRVLTFIKGGDRKKGLEQLQLAAEKGNFTRIPAKLFLMGIMLNPEKNPTEALRITGELRKSYPGSSFLHAMEMIALHDAKKIDQLKTSADDYVAKTTSGAPHYKKEDLIRGLFFQGVAAARQEQWVQALKHFDSAIASARETDPWLSWTLLWRGHVYDVLGDRASAKADYEAVLKSPKLWDIQDKAKQYLKKPYTPTEEPLKPSQS